MYLYYSYKSNQVEEITQLVRRLLSKHQDSSSDHWQAHKSKAWQHMAMIPGLQEQANTFPVDDGETNRKGDRMGFNLMGSK